MPEVLSHFYGLVPLLFMWHDLGCRFVGEQTVRLLSLWTELRRISLALNLQREN